MCKLLINLRGIKLLRQLAHQSMVMRLAILLKKRGNLFIRIKTIKRYFHLKRERVKPLNSFYSSFLTDKYALSAPELILGTLFDRIGFNVIKEDLFRHIVVARLAHPVSKLKTVDYLYRYQGINVDIDRIYRFLDVLNDRYKDTVERIAFEYSRNILGSIAVVFYDMTTLYFESEDEDDLRKIGFSKDGKFQNPQIMLGLLVGENGYPIGYDIFEGNTFEGHTLLPVIEKMCQKYGFGKPIVVADAALLSRDNIEYLVAEGYQFIIGARIKNESDAIKQQILAKAKNTTGFDITRSDGARLIVTYSEQ